jgi:hypothetical protein
MLICQCGCNEEIPFKRFHRWYSSKYKKSHYARIRPKRIYSKKACMNISNGKKEAYKLNPWPVGSNNPLWKGGVFARRCRVHNITLEHYNELLEKQNQCCAICNKPQSEFKRRFAIDHNHECCPRIPTCGKCIRGLLCDRCNKGLGHFRENTLILEKALNYMNSHDKLEKHDETL